MAGPTAASTPAKPQGRSSKIPVRHQLQEPQPSCKATQPIVDSRSVQSASVGYSSPRVPSSVGGASDHCSILLHHPTTVTQQPLPNGVGDTRQHHPTRVTVAQLHPPSGLTVTQQQHHTGVTATQFNSSIKTQQVTEQHHPTVVGATHSNTLIKTQHPYLVGAKATEQHHPTRIMMTQVKTTQSDGAGRDQVNYDTFDDENSLNFSTGKWCSLHNDTHSSHCTTHTPHAMYSNSCITQVH